VKIIFQISLAALSVLVGTFGLVLCDAYFRVVNLFWGFVCGFGWYIIGFFASERSPFAQRYGGVIWPIIVFVLLLKIYGQVYEMTGRKRRVCLALVAASFFLIVPQRWTSMEPLIYVPIYINTLNSVY